MRKARRTGHARSIARTWMLLIFQSGLAGCVGAGVNLDADGGDGGPSDAEADTSSRVDGDAGEDLEPNDGDVDEPSRDSGSDAEPLGAVYYVGPDGEDHDDCSGGTRQSPWRTFNGNALAGCIAPGDVVYFLEGTYESGTGVVGSPSVEVFAGEEGLPVTIAADPEAAGPVRFEGFFTFRGQWAVIAGIDFFSSPSQPRTGAIVKLLGSSLVLRDCLVDGSPGGGTFDCVKILSGETVAERSRDIEIVGNEIRHCPEDVIDVTGARDVRYLRNHLHHFDMMQIKGGTEAIVVEGNVVHDFRLGIRGAGMRCHRYCGSPEQPTLAVEERFVARDVAIRNNVFFGSSGNEVIGARGWRDASIYHNTFHAAGSQILVLGDTSGLQFFDDAADAHCRSHPGTCTECDGAPSCWYIPFRARGIRFGNNIVDAAEGRVIHVLDGGMASELACSHNLYHPAGSGPLVLAIEGRSYDVLTSPPESESVEADPAFVAPEEGDFHLRAGSAAIDGGAAVGVTVDFDGTPRDRYPDMGAFEHTR